jgi:hypothetical protein
MNGGITRRWLGPLVVVAVLTGCGSANRQAGEVEAVVHRWQRAVAARNVNEACSLLTESARSMIKRELAGFVAAHRTSSSCPALIGFLHDAVMTPEQRKEFGMATKASEVSITGDTAKIRIDDAIYLLTATTEGWRISEVPLATSK